MHCCISRAVCESNSLPGADGDQVLDVACGLGHEVRRLAQQVGPQGRVAGIDANPPMITEARRRGSGLHRDFVGFELQRRQPRGGGGLVLDAAGHLLAGVPQRDSYDLAGLGVGEQVEALEPGLLAGAGKLLLDAADEVIEPLSPPPGQ